MLLVSLLPSNFLSEGGLKLFGTWDPYFIREKLEVQDFFSPNGIDLLLAMLEVKNLILQNLVVATQIVHNGIVSMLRPHGRCRGYCRLTLLLTCSSYGGIKEARSELFVDYKFGPCQIYYGLHNRRCTC